MFKSIVKKAFDDALGWVEQIPFVLFTLRQMPGSETGYSPFDLMYGYRVRTPLNTLYHGIFERSGQDVKL